jgi:hypothetical protein
VPTRAHITSISHFHIVIDNHGSSFQSKFRHVAGCEHRT